MPTVALLLALTLGADDAAGQPSGEPRTVMVPMEDGIALATDVYLPEKDGPHPVMLMRTPYSAEQSAWLGRGMAERGFAVVLQDVRGQGRSEGQFLPFINEMRDGRATADWIVGQPWSNGQILLWGSSYTGHAAFELARTGHSAVQALFEISGWSNLAPFLSHGGAFQLQAHLFWYYSYASGQPQPPAEAWPEIFRTLPLSTFFDDAQFVFDRAAEPYDHADIEIPVLHVTGWYDYIYPNVLQTWSELAAREDAPNQRLIIGPWSHNGVLNSWTEVGGEEFGTNAEAGMDWAMDRAAGWYRHALSGDEGHIVDTAPVRYFVMNDNRWLEDSSWPPSNAEYQEWYLHDAGVLSRTAPAVAGSSGFVYDPNDPVPTTGGANSHFFPDNLGPRDQAVLSERRDVVRFTSEPLREDMVVAGPIKAVIYAASTGLDTDFTAKLSVIRADGYVRNIEDGIVRARRLFEGSDEAGYIRPGEILRYEIDCGATAITLGAGERLQVEVSSSNFPKYDRNPNTGVDPFKATELRPATQTIHHSPEYPSHIVVPVVR
jgi:predicted acyl esterase